ACAPVGVPNTRRRQTHCAGGNRRRSMRPAHATLRALWVKCRPLHNTLAMSSLVKAAAWRLERNGAVPAREACDAHGMPVAMTIARRYTQIYADIRTGRDSCAAPTNA